MSTSPKKYYLGFDGLRAIAATLVVWGHVAFSLPWQANEWHQKIFTTITSMSWMGVQLFFVLSGFLITTLLLDSKGQKDQIYHFYMRRSLRIFPIYYATLIFCILLLPAIGYSPDWISRATDNQIWYWVYLINWATPFIDTSGLTHFWSLAIEEQFYLFWPFIVLFLSTRKVYLSCWFMILSAPVFRYILYHYYSDLGPSSAISSQAAYSFTIARWDALAMGALLALICRQPKNIQRLSAFCKPLLFLIAGLALIQLKQHKTIPALGSHLGILNQSWVALSFALLVFYCSRANAKNILIKLLESKPFKTTGKYSYALYIVHIPIMHVYLKYFASSVEGFTGLTLLTVVNLNCLAVLFLSLVVSAITWQLIEKPCLKLKDRFN